MTHEQERGGEPADERVSTLALSTVPGIGPVRQRALVAEHGSAAIALGALPAPVAAAALGEARRQLDAADRVGAVLLTPGETGYPESLADLPDPPCVVWAIGDPALAAGPAERDLGAARGRGARGAPTATGAPRVAIVGTRRPSAYGAGVAAELSAALAQAGAVVVSGMALGVDGAAHAAALDAGGASVAVLGTGVDVPYPPRHRALHARLCERGLVLSEFAPGSRGSAGAFPRRNRLIAALCPLTIVVEAGVRSGALITAGHALDLGRAVAAVPGRIDAPEAAGTNELLRDGAQVIASAADALTLLGLGAASPVAGRPAAAVRPALDGDERLVWDALAAGDADLEMVAVRTALPASRCLVALSTLELAGSVACEPSGAIRRVR